MDYGSPEEKPRLTCRGKLILVEKLSLWYLPILKLLSLAGFHVVYMFFPDALREHYKSSEKYENALKKWGVNKFHFCDGEGSMPYGYAINAPVYAEKLFDRLFTDVLFDDLPDIFKEVSDSQEKIKIVLYEQIVGHALGFGEFLTVGLKLKKQGYSVCAFYPANSVQSYILSKDISGFINYYPCFFLKIQSVFAMGWKFGRRLFGKCISLFKQQNIRTDNQKPVEEVTKASQKVLYFPHRGVVYGNLFYKDHYYCEDADSPFHQQNIMHVEVSDDLLDNSRIYYNDMAIPHIFLNMSLGLNKRTLCQLLSALSIFWQNSRHVARLKDRITAIMIMLRSYITFVKFYKSGGASFLQAKVALVGYDFLFPSLLSMALQAHGVKVVALQERLIQMYHPSFHPIFDLYFVSGPKIKKRIEQNRFHSIKDIVAIGLVRSQRLREYRIQDDLIQVNNGKPYKKLVVVLDFHSDADPFSDSDNSMICWKANNAFYQDILRLADKIPEAHFVIRGKNIEWTKIDYFKNTLAEISQKSNVEVNSNYDEMDVSYKLVSKADLVIGRQTSLGDEAMSVGIPVLFHDWTPMRTHNVSDVYDYENIGVFVHNYEDLEKRALNILQGYDGVDSKEFSRIRESHYLASNKYPVDTMLMKLENMLKE
ncbi:MAG: hypothetical protein HWE30_07885 [Methylocystaceae bacterium]|nr:hypothetical protein [Methylocystaceae bacterium]